MVTTNADIQELIAALHTHYKSIQDKTAFLELQQSELRPADEFSFLSFYQAREQLIQEQSLLAGHAQMVQEIIAQEIIFISDADQRLLKKIVTYSRQQSSRY